MPERIEKIFQIQNDSDFNHCALDVYHFQRENCKVYGDFISNLNRKTPNHWTEIPHLPISFFKTHQVISKNCKAEKLFQSSGTGNGSRSKHFVVDLKMYENSFELTYCSSFGTIEDQVILALLPNYISQGDSSLVYMIDCLIKKTKNPLSGFYLDDQMRLMEVIHKAREENRKIVLFGVSFALLHLAEKNLDLHDVFIVETGGMKGTRKEISKTEMHDLLKRGFNVANIYSEYGMCELLSQAYSQGEELFSLPPWMKFSLREINDPFTILRQNKSGGVNIVDLANLYSCSFIETQDLGRKVNEKLQLMGRIDHSDIRGCNLLLSNDDFSEK